MQYIPFRCTKSLMQSKMLNEKTWRRWEHFSVTVCRNIYSHFTFLQVPILTPPMDWDMDFAHVYVQYVPVHVCVRICVLCAWPCPCANFFYVINRNFQRLSGLCQWISCNVYIVTFSSIFKLSKLIAYQKNK